MMKNTFVHRLTKILVDIMFYGGMICLPFVYFILKWTEGIYWGGRINSIFWWGGKELFTPMCVTLYTSGIAAVYILLQLKKMFRTLVGGNPFIAPNVSCLRKAAVACFIISIIYLIKLLWWFSFLTVFVAIVFVIAGLFCLVLKDLFKQAVSLKEENDYTV